jgi:hypothetical protein
MVAVADSGFSALELIAAVLRHVCFITRLRLEASLCSATALMAGVGIPCRAAQSEKNT